jgi:hypothetical protein
VSAFLLRKARVSEDALTGVLADLVAWWPDHAVSLLARARRFDGRTMLEPSGVTGHAGELVVTPWPRWPSGEPDLVLEFRQAAGRSLLILEAKLGAPKSSTDDENTSVDEEAVVDQLAKYYRDAARGLDRPGAGPPDRVDVVYLTHHLFAPEQDLADSHRSMRRTVAGDLFWLSWRDLERTVRHELQGAVGSRQRALRSLGAVLAQEGFARFDGAWSRAEVTSPPAPPRVFWTGGYRWRGPGRVSRVPEKVFFNPRGCPRRRSPGRRRAFARRW